MLCSGVLNIPGASVRIYFYISSAKTFGFYDSLSEKSQMEFLHPRRGCEISFFSAGGSFREMNGRLFEMHTRLRGN